MSVSNPLSQVYHYYLSRIVSFGGGSILLADSFRRVVAWKDRVRSYGVQERHSDLRMQIHLDLDPGPDPDLDPDLTPDPTPDLTPDPGTDHKLQIRPDP